MSNDSERIYTSPRVVKLVKNDSTVLVPPPRAIWTGTAGTVNFVDANGNDVVAFPLQAGLCPIRISVLKVGGTADDIWGLY